RGREQPGDHPADGERDQRRQDVQPVGQRVEQLAEPADLPEPAGEVSVDPVAGPADGEDQHRPAVPVRPAEQVQDQGYARQPREADGVGYGQDPAGDLCRHAEPASPRMWPCAASTLSDGLTTTTGAACVILSSVDEPGGITPALSRTGADLLVWL